MTELQTLRNATFDSLRERLTALAAMKQDAVMTADKLHVTPDARLAYKLDNGTARVMDMSDHFVNQMCSSLKIPRKYANRCMAEAPDLFAANCNQWLEDHGEDKGYLVRAYANDDGAQARALMSPSYRIHDNLDFLASVLQAATQSGERLQIEKADLSEKQMIVRIVAPDVKIDAEELLKQYAERFSARHTGYGTDALSRFVTPAFVLRNSEVGSAAISCKPAVNVLVCKNKLVANVDAFRSVHLGSKMSSGDIT